jgi:parallel beta-helix repeat protein
VSGKTVFVILHTLLLLGLLTLAFNVPSAKAITNVIVISPSGVVDPVGAGLNWTSQDGYTLTKDIDNTTIVVQRSNITIEGNGYRLYGPGWSETGISKDYGISITPPEYSSEAAENITIKNVRIENFQCGVFFNRTSLNLLSESNIADNRYGVWGIETYNNIFSENHLINNVDGFWFQVSSNNNVSKNKVVDSEYHGIAFSESTNNNIFENNVTGTDEGIYLQGFSTYSSIVRNNLTDSGLHLVQSSRNNVTGNNLVRGAFSVWDSHKLTVKDNFENGKPIVYLEGLSDYVFTGEAGQVTIVDCNRVRVENLSISNTGYGIVLWGSNNTVIAGNNITSTSYGIYLNSIRGAYNNTVTRNHVSASGEGVFGSVIHGSVIANNTITNTRYGIDVVGYIMFDGKTPLKTTVIGNNLSNNRNGISVGYTINCDIIGNNIKSNNNTGISLGGAKKITVYHNNFVNNSVQAVVESPGDVHVWDNGYPSGGNYWSNYAGSDVDYDGIGDAYYFINTTYPQGTQADRYPLMAPMNVFDAGIWNNKTYEVEVVSNSSVTNFSFNPSATPYPTLSFDVEGGSGTVGFCRVAIPKGLMWCDNPDEWVLTIGGQPAQRTVLEDANYTYIYFLYGHSAKTVQIKSTHAVPETQSWIMLSLLLTTMTLATIVHRKKQAKKKTI